jgi:peptidylprolyl isomerase
VPTDKRLRKKEGRQARLEAARAEARKKQLRRRGLSAVIGAAVIVALLGAIVGFGGDDKTDTADNASDGTTTTSIQDVTTSTTVATLPGLTKPTPTIPKGAAPTTLVKEDLKVGTGKEVKAGDTVTIHYVGVLYDGGKQFDASWDRGAPATFDLDSLIKGWQEGIPGMKVGGRRQLIVPPDLGYGDQANGAIPGGSTLVFVIDLIGVG